MILDLHLEKINDNGKLLEKLIGDDVPMIVNIPPILLIAGHDFFGKQYKPNYFYPQRVKDVLKANNDNPILTFGQQGLYHFCQPCLDYNEKNHGGIEVRDPWHENRCLYKFRKISIENQKHIMGEGRDIILEEIGADPKVYGTPNHQGDSNSKIAAEESGFTYFTERGFFTSRPYWQGNLKILPERKIGNKGEIFYVHYDELEKDPHKLDEIKYQLTTLDRLSVFDQNPISSCINQGLVIGWKYLRDIKTRLNN